MHLPCPRQRSTAARFCSAAYLPLLRASSGVRPAPPSHSLTQWPSVCLFG